MAIELVLTVCFALLTDMGLEILADEKNCWTAVVIEIVRALPGGREGNVATTRGNRVQGPAKIMCKFKTHDICNQQILNFQAK
jgi:hypothetical protein